MRLSPAVVCKRAVIALVLAVCGSLPFSARAEALRLRGDALAQTQSPVGLLVLRGEDRMAPWIDAESVTWLGVSDQPDVTGDVLTLSLRLRAPTGWGEARLGRQIVSTGAVRPVHLDGGRATLRAPWGTSVEAFGGVPVVRGFKYTTTDWAAGGRVAQTVGDVFVAGASYLQRRSDGHPETEEAGLDAALTPRGMPIALAGRMAFSLLSPGVSDALLSAGTELGADVRLELFGTYRSPGRLLPATSLFSVLGDYSAVTTGGTLRWRAAPRLELLGSGAGQVQGDVSGGQGFGRVTLALDDDWAGTVGLELRRVYFDQARWAGARVAATVPLPLRLRAAFEVELVHLDEPKNGISVYPWALSALTYRAAKHWDVSAALEASASPEYRRELHALARFSYAFEAGR